MSDTLTAPNFLGIDWGQQAVGLALAHAETRIAIPFATEKNDAGLLGRLKQVIESEDIGTVVIGMPSHMYRHESVHPGEILGRSLAREMSIRVVYQDEMFTTKLAQQRMIERGEKHVSQHDDAEAAGIILQEWLDHERVS